MSDQNNILRLAEIASYEEIGEHLPELLPAPLKEVLANALGEMVEIPRVENHGHLVIDDAFKIMGFVIFIMILAGSAGYLISGNREWLSALCAGLPLAFMVLFFLIVDRNFQKSDLKQKSYLIDHQKRWRAFVLESYIDFSSGMIVHEPTGKEYKPTNFHSNILYEGGME